MPQTRDDRYHSGLRCEQRIEAGVMAFPCTLPRGHDGPCYAMESARSRAARERWEAEQEETERAQPTHENCTIGHAHEGPCQPPGGVPEVHSVRAEVHPEGGYSVTLPNGTQVHLSEKDIVERPSGVIGVQDSLRQLLDNEPPGRHLLDPKGFVKEHLDDQDLVPTKQRDGDQPLPTGNLRTQDVQSLVIADIIERREVGITRYGQALRTFNGRNAIQDLYEELLDAAIYTRALLEMREALRAELIETVTSRLVKEQEDGHDTTWAKDGNVIGDMTYSAIATLAVDGILDALVMKIEGADVDG